MDDLDAPLDVDGTHGGATLDRRSILIGSALIAGAAFSSFVRPRELVSPIPKGQFERMIPDSVGAWQSRKSAELVLPAEDEGQDKLYENLETRVYEGSGLAAMMVLIAYSSVQQNDVQVHRPEVCYPAAGFPIQWTRPATVDFGSRKISARELVADRGGLSEKILYWVRVGDAYPIGWAEQRLSMAMSNAKGVIPDGLLFRVSTIHGPEKSSPTLLGDFARAFVASSPPSFRKLVLF